MAMIYTHIKTGNLYKILHECEIKIGEVWVPGVVYTRSDINGPVYCREKEKFNLKFKNYDI
jgi:hypothetical protein